MKTIGIPVYNEEKSIEKTISSIIHQINKDDEILIVANGCTDLTITKVRLLSRKDDRIKLLICKERSKISAINLILKKAKGKIIIFTDGDVILDKYAINNLIINLKNNSVGAVSGRTLLYQKVSFFDKLMDFSYKILNKKKIQDNKKGIFFALTGNLFAIKKGILKAIPQDCLIEDALIGWKIKNKGYTVIYEPNAHVYVKAPQNLKDYLNQKKRIRLGWWQMTKKGVNLVKNENKEIIKYLFTNLYAWPYLFLEIYCIISSYIDLKKGKTYWKQIQSSKI
jgi:cellulose synthase/poly-beta-1,6-N-acetylglucosamine synthase-like glycosyltransferase